MEENELKEVMIKENEEFRKAYQKHQQCEKRLEEFKKKGFLTEEDKLKEKELKKKKLALKDKMYYLMTEYRRSLP